MTVKRVLVTGGAGFIGSHSVRRLLSQGNEVVVLDNLSSGKLDRLDLTNPDLEFIEGDILEYPLLVDLVKDCDAVLHLAAIASVPMSIENPIYTFQVNTQGLLHVLEAIRVSANPIRCVYASSAAVYGDASVLPCDDAAPLSSPPLSPYALQKIEDEQYAALYHRLHGVRSLGLRYFNVYGRDQDPSSPYSGVISRFIDGYQAGKELMVFGDGLQSRDFVHVSDVALANELAINSDYQGVMNIATGQAETLLDLLTYIGDAGGVAARFNCLPARIGDIRASYGKPDLANEELQFATSVTLRDGVKSLLIG